MKTLELPEWHGEFGWEIMSWAPTARKLARQYDKIIVTSFDGMAPLYADFAEFRSHGQTGRSLDYIKNYKPDGEYLKYGRAGDCEYQFGVLIHARGISRKSSINYRRWGELMGLLKQMPVTCAVVGSAKDHNPCELWDIPGFRCVDLRGIELQDLMNQLAAGRLVVGVSSGIMHLAAACGTDIVVWGDTKTRYFETLEKRYKATWNPFNVKVGWIDADDWQPDPDQIANTIKETIQ